MSCLSVQIQSMQSVLASLQSDANLEQQLADTLVSWNQAQARISTLEADNAQLQQRLQQAQEALDGVRAASSREWAGWCAGRCISDEPDVLKDCPPRLLPAWTEAASLLMDVTLMMFSVLPLDWLPCRICCCDHPSQSSQQCDRKDSI